jgi:hypothetical protein
MCSVPELGGMEWNGSVPRSRDGSDPVFGSEKNEERNGSIPVLGFGMGWEWNGMEWEWNYSKLDYLFHKLD